MLLGYTDKVIHCPKCDYDYVRTISANEKSTSADFGEKEITCQKCNHKYTVYFQDPRVGYSDCGNIFGHSNCGNVF